MVQYALIIQKCQFCEPQRNTPEVHVHDNIIDFEKIFLKMLEIFEGFLKFSNINPLKISHYMVFQVFYIIVIRMHHTSTKVTLVVSSLITCFFQSST